MRFFSVVVVVAGAAAFNAPRRAVAKHLVRSIDVIRAEKGGGGEKKAPGLFPDEDEVETFTSFAGLDSPVTLFLAGLIVFFGGLNVFFGNGWLGALVLGAPPSSSSSVSTSDSPPPPPSFRVNAPAAL